ncbi:hypothetical protein KPSA3_01481 [Pseudomonas syringae pv. actinidiae]|uniref:Uncharacterized protein n=1 Tax=Pseudomonas syringae pv. actinidiae TaxID=103796 RepID=A0AAN4Q1J4_PSESF|nr:hypothetical protein KPSA3_01481 [Pseudomonas syringae pv. actinidiae]
MSGYRTLWFVNFELERLIFQVFLLVNKLGK